MPQDVTHERFSLHLQDLMIFKCLAFHGESLQLFPSQLWSAYVKSITGQITAETQGSLISTTTRGRALTAWIQKGEER